jgi:C1A family cysteine protease
MGFIGGNFLIKNSWGTGWGDGGYAYFDPSYITWDQTQDLWVPTLGLDMT